LTLQRAFAFLGRSIGFCALLGASALLIVMSAVLLLQVVYRYVLQLPLPWSEEAARFCLVWFAMLASCVAGQRGIHFAIRWCVNFLPSRPREAIRFGVMIFGAILLSFLAYQGFAYLPIVSTVKASATGINYTFVYASLPIGCLGLAMTHVAEIMDAILARITGEHLGLWRLSDDDAHKLLSSSVD